MTVGFTGSRDYVLMSLVRQFVKNLAAKYPDATVISGGRGNVDVNAERTGVECGLSVISYRPTETGVEVWRSEGGAPLELHSALHGFHNFVKNCFMRNEFIASADRVVAFWDLKSRGTADTISKARGKGREVFAYDPGGNAIGERSLANMLKKVLG